MSVENVGWRGATPKEELLIQLDRQDYETAVPTIVDNLGNGLSPSALSIARPDVLVGFSEAWQSVDKIESRPAAAKPNYKDEIFDSYLDGAASGDPAAIEALPKFATSLGRMSLMAAIVLDNRSVLHEWHDGRPYLQYLGTFDPQHVGHRIGILGALEATGDNASAITHVMGEHPLKKSFDMSYDDRFSESEERFYRSALLDNTRITQVDVPGGVGLANHYPKQMKLLANLSGDAEYRWLIGSDKLIFDANAVRSGTKADKAIARFSDPKMHAYVMHRKFDDMSVLESDIDYITDHFGTKITLVEGIPYDCAPASSSRVKQLRAEGKNDEADYMELHELL